METLEAEALAPMVAAANPQPDHETMEAMALPTAAGAAAAPGFDHCQETNLCRGGEPEPEK